MFSLFWACTQRAPSISSMLFLPSWKGKKHACLRVYHISGSSFKQSAKHRMYACCINLHAIVNLLLHFKATLRLSNLQWAKIGCVSVAYTCASGCLLSPLNSLSFISFHCIAFFPIWELAALHSVCIWVETWQFAPFAFRLNKLECNYTHLKGKMPCWLQVMWWISCLYVYFNVWCHMHSSTYLSALALTLRTSRHFLLNFSREKISFEWKIALNTTSLGFLTFTFYHFKKCNH